MPNALSFWCTLNETAPSQFSCHPSQPKHCFSGDYSRQFRPTAGDTTDCPCSFDPESHGLVAQPADQEGFDRLMAEFLDPEPYSPSHTTLRAPTPTPRRRRLVHHSAHHAVFSCRLTQHLRLELLGSNPDPAFLFHTFKGAVLLLTFLFASNSLLRPLPPRPDPP